MLKLVFYDKHSGVAGDIFLFVLLKNALLVIAKVIAKLRSIVGSSEIESKSLIVEKNM